MLLHLAEAMGFWPDGREYIYCPLLIKADVLQCAAMSGDVLRCPSRRQVVVLCFYIPSCPNEFEAYQQEYIVKIKEIVNTEMERVEVVTI